MKHWKTNQKLPEWWLWECFLAGTLVTELLSADSDTGCWATEQSDWDLSWPLTFLGLVGGDPGGELFIECRDETECFALLWTLFPGSLRDINFLTAWGLSVPEIWRNCD